MVQVAGTSEGKSMSFMLPAFCSPDGTTVVVVPLLALQADIQRRCEAAGIDVSVWRSAEANRMTPIVLVTPESAVTNGFATFVNQLRALQRLDRVAVDECHMLLDSTAEFRPKLQELGQMLGEVGVQKVFLTATLAPRDEHAFFKVAHIRRQDVFLVRGATTRPNIRYRVRQVRPGDEPVKAGVVEEVQRLLRGEGKVIVYSRTSGPPSWWISWGRR